MATLRKFITGSVLLYAGFMLFFLGFSITNISNLFLDDMSRWLIPLGWAISLRASIFELLGGIIAVTGFILCISPNEPAPIPPPPPPTIIIQKVPERAAPTTANETSAVPKCKFCGSSMQTGALFCPSCQKSQT
ncbi:MAG: hypothetical protein ABSD99_08810 [Candidatus Bathyarchaeia archaeon]